MSDRLKNNGDLSRQAQSDMTEREMLQLFAAVCDDSLTDDEAARFAELMEHNSAVRQRYIEYIHLDTHLRYELADAAECRPLAPREEICSRSEQITLLDLNFIQPPSCPDPATPNPLPLPMSFEPGNSSGGVFGSLFEAAGYFLPAVCRSTAFGMMLCTALGAGLATWIVVQLASRGAFAPSQPPTIVEMAGRDVTTEAEAYVATLVHATNCRWDRTRSTIDFQGRGLKPGQALHLLEGVAQINSKLPSGAVAEFQLEGPLALVLTSEGMPSLQFGRLTGSFRSDYDRFTLDTPLGRVTVSGDASIGIVSAANDVELHVFSGMAMFEYWSTGVEPFPDQLKAASGTSIRARVAADGSLSIKNGQARENRFAATTNSADNKLVISEQYVAAIRRAKPLGYWRFESDEGGVIRNEMADRLHCRIIGDAVRLHSSSGNRTAEFGALAGPGYLYSDDVVEQIGDSYATEAWVKPAYYHHATLFSLVEPADSLAMQHHFLLELCGPGPGQPTVRPWENHPNQIRYLHRGINRRGPSQCYSAAPYTLRKWQHVAIVKEKSDMRLFVDGERVARATDQVPLGNRLHVLMGQLYPKDSRGREVMQARLFVGQLDEVAFYDRALTNEEIKEHYYLARPEPESAGPDS